MENCDEDHNLASNSEDAIDQESMNDGSNPPIRRGNFRNKRYSDAYGDYAGGYGPQFRFGRPNFPYNNNFGPPGPLGFGPGPNMGLNPMFFQRAPGPGPFFGPPLRKMYHEDKAIKYLMRCGISKESLKNIPKEILQYIEPQYCGICDYSFDSFSSSRMHYTSRNHSKMQKAWFGFKLENAAQRKQAPFKSREVYCELCDIQITSKVHADAHYAGKPHRAIVEGRKYPKNVMLQKKSMEGRVAQLINREKKFLKPVPDQPVQDEKKGNDAKQSELYCDICKTTATCSEQMTMHLNGKKHLNKEKQHILKIMKGIPTDEETQENVADADDQTEQDQENESSEVDAVAEVAVDTAQEETNAENENDNKEEEYDWANGSGQWDDGPDLN